MGQRILRLMRDVIFAGSISLMTVPLFATSATSGPSATVEQSVTDLLNSAEADYKERLFTNALSKAKQADGIQNKPGWQAVSVHRTIVRYALAAKEWTLALDELDRILAANEGNRIESLKEALATSMMLKDKTKAAEYARQLGGNLSEDLRLEFGLPLLQGSH